jgi:2-polyprenyl-3-methyl-5-hydroxy-6-metoxy-1,4-benzoquinol methylase
MAYDKAYFDELHSHRSVTYGKVAKAHAPYIDPVSGLFDIRLTEIRPCPVCGSAAHRTLFKKSGGLYVKCVDCGMVFTNPGFTDAALERYYTNLDVGHADNLERESAFFRELYSRGIAHFSPYARGKRLMDLGCSSGFFLDIAREHGYETFGLELNVSDVEIAVGKGHDVRNLTIDRLNAGEGFDVIAMWDVFEHILKPTELLREVFARLKPGGLLFLQIPNSGSVAARVLQHKCNMFDGLEHVCLYNPSTISKLMTDRGYNVKSIRSVIPETYAVENYMAYEDPYLPSAMPDATITERLSDEFVLERLLGYKLQVVVSR